MTTSFKLGDIVQLKSGGPKMTVTQLNVYTSGNTQTKWFAGSKAEMGVFPAETLTLVNDDGKK